MEFGSLSGDEDGGRINAYRYVIRGLLIPLFRGTHNTRKIGW